MFKAGSSLVILQNNEFLLCDDFYFNEDTRRYESIVIYSKPLNKTFSEDEVLLFSFNQSELKSELDSLVYGTYGGLFSRSVVTYKQKNSVKQAVEIKNTSAGLSQNGDEQRDKIRERYKKLADEDDSIIATTSTGQIKDLTSGVRDIKDLEGLNLEIINFICMYFHIKPDILFGKNAFKTDEFRDFATFTIAPLCNMIQNEINRKYYKKKGFLEGSRVLVDTSKIRHIDILDSAQSLDYLYRIGFSHNDLREILGQPKILEDWANAHYVTKNYMDMKGGEEDETIQNGV